MNRLFTAFDPRHSAQNRRLITLLIVALVLMQIASPLGAEASAVADAMFAALRLIALAAGFKLAELVLERYAPAALRASTWLIPVLAVPALAALPLTLVEVGLERWLPVLPEYDDSAWWVISPALAIFGEYATLLAVLLPANGFLYLVIDRGWLRHAETALDHRDELDEPDSLYPAFLDKTRGIHLQQVVALEAHEHYVQVHTHDGAELIHHRFGDAVASMPEHAGLQVHRSYWVAELSVVAAKRDGRRYRLTLENGMLVPVSDKYLRKVRERGLLRRRHTLANTATASTTR